MKLPMSFQLAWREQLGSDYESMFDWNSEKEAVTNFR